jgi:hypothetical protein
VEVWELIVVLVLLKIPVAYVGWVMWWAIKAEPEIGTEGGTEGPNWQPWRRPPTASPAHSRRGAQERARERGRDRGGARQHRVGGPGS